MSRDVIIKDTHRGLWYEDGVLTRVVSAGKYKVPDPWSLLAQIRKLLGHPTPWTEIVLVDVREREPLRIIFDLVDGGPRVDDPVLRDDADADRDFIALPSMSLEQPTRCTPTRCGASNRDALFAPKGIQPVRPNRSKPPNPGEDTVA